MKLVYFAWVKERIGISEEDVQLPDHVKTAQDLLEWLAGRGANYAHALSDLSIIRVAIDQEYAQPDALIGNAIEVALFPPVTGG